MAHSVRWLFRSSLLGLLAFTVLLYGQAQDTAQQKIIASINGKYTISWDDIEKYVYDSHLIYMYRKDKAKAYQKAVDGRIINQLKLIDFFALGLDKDAELIQSIRRTINEELVIRYYETQFYGKYVNEDSMRSAYREMGKEVVYQQIVLAKPKDASQKALAALKSRANSIADTLRNGADFTEVAKHYAPPDASTRPGDPKPPLSWRLSLSSNLNYTIFHLADHEVRVIEGKESIFIVKVAEVRSIDVPPYEQVREGIQGALDQRYSDYSLKQFERTKQNLIDERKLTWNSKALQQLVRWSNIPHFYEAAYSDTLRNAISRGANPVILTYSKGRVDLSEYLRLLNDVLTWGNFTTVKEDNIKNYVLEAVRTDMLVKKANALNLEKEILQPQTKNSVLRDGIVRLYSRREIEDRIPQATEQALRDFYQVHKDTLFYQLAKVNIYAVIDSSKRVVEEAKQKFEQNVPFEKLAHEIFVKTYVRGRDGTFDTYLADEPPYLSEAAFKLKLNETAGPIEYSDSAKGRQYALIKCVGIRDEKQLSYSDVEKTIAATFTKYYREQITRATEEALKKKYTVTLYPQVLNDALASIGVKAQ